MILNNKKWRKFEQGLIKNDKTSLSSNLKIMDELYKEAVSLKVFPLKDPLDGLDVLIRIAKVLNSV